ncbi:MAG: hypothetical protein Q7K45_05555, partial [Nanoarchaeota archaeon]|nr:hypothetical protein [Nanoarchaeota archaeon]
GSYTYGLLFLGVGTELEDQLPHDFIISQSYIHGDPLSGGKRGIALNSRSTTIEKSYFSNWKGIDQDTQAIAGWNGPGPFDITNNYIEAAGENIMFGGAPSVIPELVPADIEIRDNYFSKPLEWNQYSPTYDGSSWIIKNVLELKNARNVHIEHNIIEHSWVQEQSGFAVLLTPRNQDGNQPWTVVEDVTIENNIIRHAAAGINIVGYDDNAPTRRTNNIIIRNNVFTDIGGDMWGRTGPLFQLIGPIDSVTIDHNTAFHQGSIILAEEEPNAQFVFTNNIVHHNQYGIFASSTGSGNAALRYFLDAQFSRNIIIDAPEQLYSSFTDNYFPASIQDVGIASDYSLSSTSTFKNAGTDGKDIGADVNKIQGD